MFEEVDVQILDVNLRSLRHSRNKSRYVASEASFLWRIIV